MDWLKAILEKMEITDGKVDIEKLMTTIKAEGAKNVMPKVEYNNVNSQLKIANDTIATLKKDNADNVALQETIKTNKATIDTMKIEHSKELNTLKIDMAIKESLSKAGCKYVDLVSKDLDMKKITVSEEGTVLGIEEQLKTVKENYKDMFTTETDSAGADDAAAYRYKPGGANSNKETVSTSFVDIINSNQAKR